MDETATLQIGDKQISLNVSSPSEGQDVIDIASLVSDGFFTFDPGFLSTASCESALTYIDGDIGKLLHRGYPIEQLAEESSFLELCYLLLDGELPTKDQLDELTKAIKAETVINQHLLRIAGQFPRDSHPMGIMCALVAAMSAFYHEGFDASDESHRRQVAVRLIAQMPICAAITFRHITDRSLVSINPDMTYSEQFLHLMFSDSDDDEVDPVLSRAMDRIFLLHADHEQNASTSTVRLTGSTDANPYACVAAGIAALWGPAHGGANEAVLRMIDDIGEASHIGKYVAKAKDRDDPFRIMGFGHRVYKNYDPRAHCMQSTCHEVLDRLGIKNDATLEIANALEKVALQDEYFIERRLYPNVDFYSGVTLKAMGIPKELFTVIFVVGRTIGWIAQWDEMVRQPYKIGRPRQKYTGPTARDYVAIGER